MDDVKVRYNSDKPAQLQALAYTQGTDIHVAPGQEKHLPHEAWHVVQQKQGRVQPTLQAKGVAINDDRRLEREADEMGEKALQMKRSNPSAAGFAVHSSVVVRRKGEIKEGSKSTEQRNSSNGLTIQLLTTLGYNPIHNRPSTDAITSMLHERVYHNATQKTLAAYLSGYDNVQDAGNDGCTTCNHYVPYNWVSNAVRTRILTPASLNLGQAVTWMNNLPLPAGVQINVSPNPAKASIHPKPWAPIALGGIPVPNIPAIPAPGGGNTYSESVLNTNVDDLIFNLANDPRNLFYWPHSTGDNNGANIDDPTGAGAMNLPSLRIRLSNYRTFLQGLGLNV